MKRVTKTASNHSYNNITKSGAFQTFEAHHFRVLLDIFSYQSVTPSFAKATQNLTVQFVGSWVGEGPNYRRIRRVNSTPPVWSAQFPVSEWRGGLIHQFPLWHSATNCFLKFSKGSHSTHLSCHGLRFLPQKNILDQLVAAKPRRSKFRSQMHFQVHLRGGR